MCHPKWLVRNTKQMKSQTHQTHTTPQYIASDEIMRRVIPHERKKKCSRGRYGEIVNKRQAVTSCPSFCWLEVLQARPCPLKQAKRMRGPHTAAHQLWAPIPAVGAASPVHDAQHPCRLHFQAAPGTQGRAHSLQRCQEAAAPDQCCRPAQWQSSFLPMLLWHGQEQLACCRANHFKKTEIVPKWHRTLSLGKPGAIFPCSLSSTVPSISSLAFSNV